MKIVFMGTPGFAVPCLEKLNERFDVVAVFTQPDRPKGRGQKMQMSAVKEVAVKLDIPVYQPLRIKNDTESIDKLKEINPDVIVVAAYGQILPKTILDIPRYGCINVHASLLPKLRGAAPINWAIINGESKSGITIMQMAEGLDTGDMLLKEELIIGDSETAGELHDRLMVLGGEMIVEALLKLEKGEIIPEKQNDAESNYAPMLNKELGYINWNKNCKEIYNLIRGVNPYPGAYGYLNDKMVKFFNSVFELGNFKGMPGEILEVNKKGISIKCKDGKIIINELQEVGGKRMSVEAYLNGHIINNGEFIR